MQLTTHQLNFFHTFGYLVFRELFGPDEIAWIIDEFEDVMQTYAGGKMHDGSKPTMIVPTIDHSERLCTLLDDARIEGIASGILGDDFNYASGDGNYYCGDTDWHTDGNYPKLFAIKMVFYLDALTRDTGCLRVLPGSHRRDSLWRSGEIHPRDAQHLWGLPPSEIPGVAALATNPGDLVVFYHDILHASFGGSTRRRMFTMNLNKHAATESEMARIDEYVRGHCPVAHGFKIGGMYTEIMLNTASPQRMHHLAQLRERHALVYPHDTRHS